MDGKILLKGKTTAVHMQKKDPEIEIHFSEKICRMWMPGKY